MMEKFYQKLNELTAIPEDILNKIALSLLTVAILLVIRYIIVRIIWRSTEDVGTRYHWRRSATYTLLFLFLVSMSYIWIDKFKDFGTFLGILSAGIAIALKDLLTNFVGWTFIMTRKPFRISHRIEIDGVIGDVIDIHVFRFTVLEAGNWVDADQTTGRIVHIPNGLVFTKPLFNYHAGFNYIWNEIPVLITFESNWKKAREILTGIINERADKISNDMVREIKEASKKFMIHYNILTPIVYTSVKDFGVMLTMRYLCRPRIRRGSEAKIWEDVLEAFAKCDDIDFAYPTQRFYNNMTEGKTGARAKPEWK